MKLSTHYYKKGFTLVEILVSLSLFIIIMVIGTGSLVVVNNSNKKASASRKAIDGISHVMEDMSRNIRLGSSFRCTSGVGELVDCQSSGYFSFIRTVQIDSAAGLVEYQLVNGVIQRRVTGLTWKNMTSSDVMITDMKFSVSGAHQTDDKHARVLINIKGNAGKGATKTEFALQTTVGQRDADQ